jgi:hypothetical protein
MLFSAQRDFSSVSLRDRLRSNSAILESHFRSWHFRHAP